MQVSLCKIHQCEEVAPPDALQDGLGRLHLEPVVNNVLVQGLEIENCPPASRGLLHQEQPGIKSLTMFHHRNWLNGLNVQ